MIFQLRGLTVEVAKANAAAYARVCGVCDRGDCGEPCLSAICLDTVGIDCIDDPDRDIQECGPHSCHFNAQRLRGMPGAGTRGLHHEYLRGKEAAIAADRRFAGNSCRESDAACPVTTVRRRPPGSRAVPSCACGPCAPTRLREVPAAVVFCTEKVPLLLAPAFSR